jgi:hypothetical protein
MRSMRSSSIAVCLAVAAMTGASCDVPRGPDPAGVAGVDLTPEEVTVQTSTPKPEPGEKIISSSLETQLATGIGFYTVKKGRTRAFSEDGKKVLATISSTFSAAGATAANVKLTFTVGSRKVTANMKVVDEGDAHYAFSGDANGKKFSFLLRNDELLSGAPFTVTGNMASVLGYVGNDLAAAMGHEEQPLGWLCMIGAGLLGFGTVTLNPVMLLTGAALIAGEC